MSKILNWDVHGMHCPSCERIIEQEVQSIDGVAHADVNMGQKRLTVTLKAEGNYKEGLKQAFERLNGHGYTFQRQSEHAEAPTCDATKSRAPLGKRMIRALFFVAGAGLLFGVVLAPFQRMVPAASGNLTTGAMLFFGIIASLSTCLASTGGFLLAYTSQASGTQRKWLVHAGRMVTFVAGGAVLGSIGGALPNLTGGFYGWLALLLGIGFLIVGLNLLNVSPSMASMGIRLPKSLNKLMDTVLKSEKPYTPFLVGAVTFVIPCGFTQTAQALALASGSPVTGAVMLGLFALGTMPVLAGLTAFGSAATLNRPTPKAIVGAALFIFAFGQIDGGLTVLGSPVTPSTVLAGMTRPAIEATAIPVNAQEQTVEMRVIYGTYQPKNLTVKKDVPVRWVIHGDDINGCSRDITIPTMNIYQVLKEGMNVITFTPTKSGVIPFSCGMGMMRGTFTVVE
ncbi:hypothetical protein GF380_04845 [Candidatus Uhrbacteria bacterium]|nr:hypothetical protein [Candidatus Uhrbacteria bacterium]MBD3284374.1 hypothetical protein [Candidatus Uhrbacteria bacterium]